MNKNISTDVLVAYSQCPRKAYLLLCTEQKGKPHEYARILQRQKIANHRQYINALKQKHSDVQSYAEKELKNRCDFLVGATLQADGLEADCGLLVKVKGNSILVLQREFITLRSEATKNLSPAERIVDRKARFFAPSSRSR